MALSATLVVALLLPLLASAQPQVTIPNVGSVSGLLSGDGQVQLFLGIPYGQAQARWQVASPRPLGLNFQATSYGEPCYQVDDAGTGFMGSEDCLSLNIYTPVTIAGQQGVLPVMVWTYGGSFLSGTSRSIHYNATEFVSTHNVIIVTYNYRLGPFGFAGMPELLAESPTTGMYGIDDSRAAFTWVQSNIRYFGGDPSKVTAFGESAGGIITCILTFSPLAQGLFRNAILESGNCDFVNRPQSQVFAVANHFATLLNCTDQASRLTCMRNRTPSEIMVASLQMGGGSGFSQDGSIVPWLPSLDNVLLVKNPMASLLDGTWRPVPILLGANRDSFSLFMVNTPLENISSLAEAKPLIENLFKDPSYPVIRSLLGKNGATAEEVALATAALTNYYLTTYTYDYRYMVLKAYSDATFLCGARRMAQGFSQYTSDVYLYEFQHHPSQPPTPAWMGAYHFAEVNYIFASEYYSQFLPAEKQLSRSMQQYWAGFATSGSSPNSAQPMGTFPAANWPNYNAVSDLTLGLNLTLNLMAGNNNYTCPLWDQIFLTKGAWPTKAGAASARLNLPAAPPAPAVHREATIVISVVISVLVVLAVAAVAYIVQRRKGGPVTDTSGKYTLYAN